MLRSTHLPIALGAVLTTAATAADFHMIHATRGNAAIGVFTPAGPQLGTMQQAPRRLDFITYDTSSGTYFGQQTSTLGIIESGTLTPIETPEPVDLSHAGGLAFDGHRGTVLVASKSGAGTVLFEYDPTGDTWDEIGNVGRDDFHGLACDGDQGTIYILHKPHHTRGCTNVRVFNRSGAQVAAVDLSTPIPFYPELRPKLQLAFAEGSLYAMVSFAETHPRVTDAIYVIDPTSGTVNRAPYLASTDVTSTTWPRWSEGPAPSAAMAASGAEGSGFYSSYQTPAPLVSGQTSELHVVSAGSGAMRDLEWLKKIKKFRASTTKSGGVAVELEIDPEAETQRPVVELFVGKTARPVTLALVSGSAVTWSIETAPDARIAQVITFGAPFFSASEVVGVDAGLVVEGDAMTTAHAWELEQGTRFDAMIAAIRTRTGLRENSFQGLARASTLRIPLPPEGAQHAAAGEGDE